MQHIDMLSDQDFMWIKKLGNLEGGDSHGNHTSSTLCKYIVFSTSDDCSGKTRGENKTAVVNVAPDLLSLYA